MLINWDLALQDDSTLVFYMGLSNLQEITKELLKRGAQSKAFCCRGQGTSDAQQVIIGTISDIAFRLQDRPLPSPALLIMGMLLGLMAMHSNG